MNNAVSASWLVLGSRALLCELVFLLRYDLAHPDLVDNLTCDNFWTRPFWILIPSPNCLLLIVSLMGWGWWWWSILTLLRTKYTTDGSFTCINLTKRWAYTSTISSIISSKKWLNVPNKWWWDFFRLMDALHSCSKHTCSSLWWWLVAKVWARVKNLTDCGKNGPCMWRIPDTICQKILKLQIKKNVATIFVETSINLFFHLWRVTFFTFVSSHFQDASSALHKSECIFFYFVYDWDHYFCSRLQPRLT